MESGQTPEGGDRTEQERRQRLIKLVGAGVFVAVLAVVILIVVSQSGDKGGDTKIERADSNGLEGLHQKGDTVGDPSAAVTIVEYGDLQCPICRAFAARVTPDLLDGPVADGQAKLQYQNWAILGPDSVLAAKAALAAAQQDKLWSFVDLFYKNQGAENTGYVTDEFLTAIADKAGLDVVKWDQDRFAPDLEAQLKAVDGQATALGFTGTPSILVRGPGGEKPLPGVPSTAQIEDAITQVGG